MHYKRAQNFTKEGQYDSNARRSWFKTFCNRKVYTFSLIYLSLFRVPNDQPSLQRDLENKDPELQSLLDTWSEANSNEKMTKRKICFYLHMKIGDKEDVQQIFKEKYEELLILYYGKSRYPEDSTYTFLSNNTQKQNLKRLVKNEIYSTIILLKSKLKLKKSEEENVYSFTY